MGIIYLSCFLLSGSRTYLQMSSETVEKKKKNNKSFFVFLLLILFVYKMTYMCVSKLQIQKQNVIFEKKIISEKSMTHNHFKAVSVILRDRGFLRNACFQHHNHLPGRNLEGFVPSFLSFSSVPVHFSS